MKSIFQKFKILFFTFPLPKNNNIRIPRLILKGVYSDDVLDVDEIWLVFDTEVEMRAKWKENWDIVKK